MRHDVIAWPARVKPPAGPPWSVTDDDRGQRPLLVWPATLCAGGPVITVDRDRVIAVAWWYRQAANSIRSRLPWCRRVREPVVGASRSERNENRRQHFAHSRRQLDCVARRRTGVASRWAGQQPGQRGRVRVQTSSKAGRNMATWRGWQVPPRYRPALAPCRV